MTYTIAVVANVTGQAWAEASDGSRRLLEAGDALMAGERLITGENAEVILDFGYGETAAIGGNVTILASAEMASDFVAEPQDTVIEDDSVAAALASIEEALGGAIEDAEAPAAGLEGGSAGGSSSVRLARIIENIDPAGLDLNFTPYSFNAVFAETDSNSGDDLDGDDNDAVAAAEPEIQRGVISIESVEGGNLQSSSVQVSGSSSNLPEGTPVLITLTDQAGNTLTQEVLVGANGTFTAVFENVSGLIDGPFTARATATDPNGELASDLAGGNLDLVAGDLGVAIDSVSNVLQTIDLSGTSNDVAPGDSVSLTITDSAGNTVNASVIVADDGSFAVDGVDISNLVDGPLTVGASAEDRNGNELLAEAPDQVILDAADGALTVVVDAIDNSGRTIDLSGTTEDVAAGEPVTLTITDAAGNVVVTNGIVNADGSYAVEGIDLTTANGVNLVDGELTIDARATDRNNNDVIAEAPAGAFLNAVDDVPVITGDTAGTVGEDNANALSANGDLNATGGDAGEDQFIAETLVGAYGELVVTEDGGWTYSADNGQAEIQGLAPGETLTESFTVTNADGVTTETVTITINGTDDVPVISGDTVGSVVDGDAAVLTTAGTLSATGGDAGEDQFAAETLTGTYGELVMAADGGWTYSADGNQAAIQGLAENESLTDTFTVTNADGVTTETVTITINGTDDVPVISGQTSGSVTEDAAATLATSGVLAATGGDTGEDQFNAETLTGTYGELVMAADGTWTYSADNSQATIPELAPGQNLTDSFVVTNADGVTTETVTITINGTDDVPVISGQTSGSVTEDAAATLTTSGVLAATGGDTGEDQFNAETLTGTYGELVMAADGTWTYSADNSQAAIQGLTQNDSLTETFTVTNADGVTTETVTITINGTDDVPVISGDTSGSVTEDDASTLTTTGALAANNGDAGEDQFNAENITGTYGDLVIGEDGAWTYSADNSQAAIQELAPGQNLTDSFVVTNADGVTTETVTITINGTDDVPVISGDTSGSVTEDDAATLTTAGTLAATGGDAGEDQFNAETLTGTYGNLVVGEDGSWTYSADNSQAAIQGLTQNDSLTETFTVTNADGVTTETVIININGTDDVPVISGQTAGSVTEDDASTLTTSGALAANNGDAGEDQFNAETLTGTYGELAMAADGTWTYSADNSQAAIQSLTQNDSLTETFTVTNADGVTTETVTITINGTDDVPVISGQTSGSVTEDDAAILTTAGTLAASGGDAGEGQFNAETIAGTYGNLVIGENGSWSYSADNGQAAIQELAPGQSLTDSFVVTNADGVTTETVTITINGTDDVPVISGQTSGAVTEDDATTLTTSGVLAANNGDAGEDQFNAETLTGTYGELVMAADGTWTYSADNSQAAIQELAPGQNLTDSFVVTNADGVTTETVTITINGTDDVPVISGQTAGSVTEDDAATLTTTGALAATGGDAGEDQFNAETLTGTYGKLVIGEDGTWTFSADGNQAAVQGLTENESLTDTFTVTNADGVTTETVTITINGTDDVPVISGQTSGSVTEDATATLTATGALAATGGDNGEDQFNAETLTGTYGELAMAADGTWTYSAGNSQAAIQELAPGQNLTDSFVVTNADGVTTETVTITINGTDDVPVISGQTSGSVTEDATTTLTATGALAATGGDNGKDQFNAETLTGTYGELAMAADGTWTYSAGNSQAVIQGLAQGQNLTDSFVITNADGVTTETITITINGTDDVPVISGQTSGSVTEDAAATLTTTGTLAAAGGDAGEDQFVAETLTGTYGELVMVADGTWTYSADNSQAAIQGLTQNDSLTDSFVVTNADGVTTETVTITINGTDDVPVISGQTSGSVTEDDASTLTTTGVLAASNGDAGEDQFVAETLAGTYGELVMAADGTWTYSADNGQAAIQELAPGQSLTDSFTVTNADGVTTETVTITINGTDDVPVISGQTSGAVTEDDAATLTTAGTLAATGGDAGEDQFVAETLAGTYGELAMAADGTWTYNADNSQAAIQGLTQNDSLTDSFVVTNADGVTTETVTITINGTDDVPVISGQTSGSVTEDEAATLTTTGTLAATGGDTGEDQFNAETLAGTYGNLVVGEDGSWTYSADNSQAEIQGLTQNDSLSETFTVTNADGVTTETVTITINGTDDVPVISGQTAGSVTEDEAATLTTTGTLATTGGDAGEDQFNAETLTGTYGELVMAADGTWTYSADNSLAAIQGLTQNDSLTETFTVTNADGVTTETVTITINGTDDVPVISGQTSGSVTEDDASTLTTTGVLAASNGDAGEDQFVAETLTGTYGELVMAADGTWTYSADNSQAAIQELAPGQSLTDSFVVTNADGVTTETVTITINGTDDVPVISGQTSGAVTEDDAATLTTAGTLAATGGDAGEDQFVAETLAGTYGELVMAADGAWTYSADNSQVAIQELAPGQNLTDSFVVTNADGITTETVTITINGTDDVPAISGQTSGSVTEDDAATLTTSGALAANNGDAGEDQFVAETLAGTYGELAMAADGTWTYSADNSQAAIQELAPGQNLTDSFVVTNADGVTTETVTITINGTDDVPVISGDTSGFVTEDDAATLTTSGVLAANNGDTGEDQFVAETLTGTYGELVMAADGTWTYSADNSQAAIQGLTQNDSLTETFTVTNADGVTTETVTITINGTDDVPVISGQTSGSVTEDDAATLTSSGVLAANNGDAGEDQFVAETLAGTYGELVMAADGAWTYRADNSQAAIQELAPGQNLTDSFVVTNADGITTETVTITINGTDDVPVISGQTSGSVTEDEASTLTTSGVLAANNGDAGEDQFVAETLAGTYGELVMAADGTWTYSADNSQTEIQDLGAGESLSDTFTVTNADGVTTETVTITINGTNDVPVISGDISGSVTEDEAATLTTAGALTASGGDTGEDQFVAETLTGTYGELVMAADGTWTYSADNSQAAIQDLGAGESLSDTFTVTNADGVTIQDVTITINGTNEAPVATADTYANGSIPGLSGEYFAYVQGSDGANLTNLGQVEAFIASTTADATFTGTAVNYGSVSGGLGGDQRLQNFLKGDANSLSNDPANSSDAIIKMTGELELAPGTYQFQVRADDGYSIRVNGEVVAEFNDNQGATTRTGNAFTLAGDGPHTVEIIYWDQGGSAQLNVSIREQGGQWQVFGAQQASHPAVNDALVVDEGDALVIAPETLLSNDSDVNGDALTIQSVQNAANGTVALDQAGNVVFTPDDYFSGEASFSYTVSDGNGGTDTATVTVAVRPVADAPTLSVSDAASLQIGQTTISTGLVDNPVDPSENNSGNGISQAALERELGVEQGFLDGRFDPQGKDVNDPGFVNVIDGKVTADSQKLTEGMTISWDYSFINGEEDTQEVSRGFNDLIVLVVTNPDGSRETYLVDSTENKFPNEQADGSFSFNVSDSGQYSFQWLVLNGGDSLKDSSLTLNTPTVTVPGFSGNYAPPVSIYVDAGLQDRDGSETLEVTIEGVPANALLSAGSKNTDGSWALSETDLDGLQLIPAAGYTGQFELTVTATSTEIATGEQQTVQDALTVTIDQTDATRIGDASNNSGTGNSQDELIRLYDGDDVVGGGAGDDYIQGGAGNDTLTGGVGNDVLTGGVGADVFRWELGDQGSTDTAAQDTVTDFTIDPANGYTGTGEGDQLELSDLLQDASASTITDYLMAQEENGDTVLYLNKDGALDDNSDNAQQSITLTGVSMDGQTSEQFIDSMLNSGHIKIE